MKARLVRRRRESFSADGPENQESHPPARMEAFTLLEILLALGLIALMATILIGGSVRVLGEKPASVDDVFWKATREARKIALETGRDARLAFVDDREHGKRFVIDDSMAPQVFPLVTAVDLSVTLLPPAKSGSAGVFAVGLGDAPTLPFATFYADGTCTAFRVQVRLGPSTRMLTIDPWTCAPVLPAEGGR
ncbi:MAG: hypothetical protein ABIZ81_14530 [Opitutaceae bacterium]